MGIFDFFFGKKKESDKFERNDSQAEQITQTHYINIASQNQDVIAGVQFHATCQLRTPLDVFKKHGEIFTSGGIPPTYGAPKDGIWLPKLKDNSFDFLDNGATTASDAGPVDANEYVNYAIGLLSIFELDITINEKMAQALVYAGNDESKNRIQRGLLNFYGEKNIADVMSNYISNAEKTEYYYDKPGKLTLVNGVNKKIAESLEKSGVDTIKILSSMNENDLINIKGIGKITAQKIMESVKELG